MYDDREAEVTESEFDIPPEGEREVAYKLFDESLDAVPQRKTVIVNVTTPIAEAIRAMNEEHVGCALVVRENQLKGIFTERDVLRKVAGTGIDVHHTPVERVMTPDPVTLPAHAEIAYALRRMSDEGYRNIPLIDDDGRPTGVVTMRDIIAWLVSTFPKVINLPPEPGYPHGLDGG